MSQKRCFYWWLSECCWLNYNRNTTSSSSISTGSIGTPGGIGLAKNINAGGIIKTTDTTASSSTSTGSIVAACGIGVAGTSNFGGKVTITTTAAAQGLDLVTADSYANMRVIQNTTATADKDMYIGLASGATRVFIFTATILAQHT